MERRKRWLKDLKNNDRTKVQKRTKYQTIHSSFGKRNLTNNDDIFAVTSLIENENKTTCRSTDVGLKGSEKSEVFVQAGKETKQLTRSRVIDDDDIKTINNGDITRNTEDCRSRNLSDTHSKVYVRDDSGYLSSDFSDSLTNSDDGELIHDDDYLIHPEETKPTDEAATVESTVPSEIFIKLENKCAISTSPNHYGKHVKPSKNETETLEKEANLVTRSEKIGVVLDFDLDASDVIIPCDCTDYITDVVPKSVNKRWARNSSESQIEKYLVKHGSVKRRNSFSDRFRRANSLEPDQTSTIYIQHRYEDNPIGDEFGTDIWTFRTKSKDGTEFDQHYFVNVKPNGPAAKMKIRENDELVLFNSIFVPNKTHNDLLNLFHKVKIDGRTRIELVIRRVSKVKKKKIWEWIDTSAILGPDCHHDKEKYLEVISPRETTVQGNIIEFRSLNKYRIKGYSQHYLEINNDTVVADVMTKTTADKKKIFLKIVQCYWNNDTMMFDYKAALYSESAGKYIVVGSDNQIKLDEQIMWFGFKKTDEHPEFKSTSNGLFLGCNRETHKIEMQTRKDDLEEFSAESGTDHPDQSRPINAPISYNGTSICYAEKYATCSDLCEKMSKEHCLTARSEGLFHQSGLETMSTDGGDIQMDDLRDHSETAIVKTNMTLHIPNNSEADARRSLEIIKTPVTPFKSMLILN